MVLCEKSLKELFDYGQPGIYGYRHGEPLIQTPDGGHERDKVIFISKSQLVLMPDAMLFDWEQKEPLMTIYRYSDYGRTWAFIPGDIYTNR